MEIEILTTKKKLTKSLLKQMHELGIGELKDGVEVLGYINNIDKVYPRVFLIKTRNNEYRIAHYFWNKSKVEPEKIVRDGGFNKQFSSEKNCDEYYDFIVAWRGVAKQIYI